VVEDDARSRDALGLLLEARDFAVTSAASLAEARALTAKDVSAAGDGAHDFDLVFLDLGLPDGDGLDLIRPLVEHPGGTSVVVLTGERRLERAIEAMRRGAADYLVKPLDAAALSLALGRLERALDERDERRRITRELIGLGHYQGMVGHSPPMRRLFEQLDRAAPSELPIFVRGESGTGKELVARAVHQVSRRRRAPFVALNCGAIPSQLAESELFGHERGSFTGATRAQIGAFERASGGTLFLDEVTEMPLDLQVALLRVLEQRTIQRVGGAKEIAVDVRIVAATNRDLAEAVRDGRFRADLRFRLDVLPLSLPPLRERGDDVLVLAHHFLAATTPGENSPSGPAPVGPRFSSAALEALRQHPWPGNVRELKNAVQRAAVLHQGPEIEPEDLGLDATTREPQPPSGRGPDVSGEISPSADVAPPGVPQGPSPISINPSLTLAEAERVLVLAALERHAGHRGHAALALGIAPKTLYNKLRAWGID
jgi:DNA-binding NtrC family response regulator